MELVGRAGHAKEPAAARPVQKRFGSDRKYFAKPKNYGYGEAASGSAPERHTRHQAEHRPNGQRDVN